MSNTALNAASPSKGANLRLPACLIIMDGFGLAPSGPGNAISLANTPVIDNLLDTCSHVRLQASGTEVGLPSGQMGNSEVGHLNIGAGRIVAQELTRIDTACASGELSKNDVLRDAFSSVINARLAGKSCALHLLGLLSDGGVHSSNKHLYALIEAALDAGVEDVRVHCFMDGRDVPPTSGVQYISELQEKMNEAKKTHPSSDVFLSSISGRYYAMDRDNRWERVERAFDAIACALPHSCKSAQNVMADSYSCGVTDEFIEPVNLDGRGIQDDDVVVFFNFRPDRARELTRSFTDVSFDGFARKRVPNIKFVTLTEYDPDLEVEVAFPKVFPENVLADVFANAGLTQYHIAETEKYAHVTFFLNGGIEEPKRGEIRKLIPSPKVATYDLQPEMSEPEVASTLEGAIRCDDADVYIVNFANCDMVGHTGIVDAAKRAVEAVDDGVGRVLSAIRDKKGVALLSADHGNADCMIAPDGTAHTAHTCAPVPLVLIDYSDGDLKLNGKDGKLADIAPTLLDIIGLDIPEEMTGNSLIAH